ncbi:GntR family transcriptional regulator [Sedimentitalea sp. JM2-8]|uniref:GntR family transcriptional regulator n=1 Tax=Sedimentitalea xiamensis TaxID=3050037 RepID=A0ABT7FH23_9RHOB|nr:GntR family transcriptional regulator [Sedimentitalea xiamensis]MDK3074449.1 GntR family transcriptional regulator [Sedimentitalea xiamensis]
MSTRLFQDKENQGAEMLGPLKSEPALIDLVHGKLVQAIAVGRLPPGERLTQDRVAELLDVSRQPVSHAMQVLKHQGLVVQHGRKGLAVAPLDAQQIWHLYQVREVLDGLAARLAAVRVASGGAVPAELDALQAAFDAGAALRPDADTIDLVHADVAFHRALHDLSGNPEIARTVSEQWPQFMRSMAAVLDDEGHRAIIWEEHAAIAAAVLAGDADLAEARSQDHARRAGEEIRNRIDQMHERQAQTNQGGNVT